MRLIDADALMEVIREHDYPLRSHFNSTDNGMFTLGIQQAVYEAPTIEPVKWISVSERLPEDVGSYLVYYHEWSNGDFLPKYEDYRIRVMRFMNNGKWCMPVCTDKRCEADTNREVTHWMPLPEPPGVKDGHY